MEIISIDQNSNSLWDTLPKLQALEKAGYNFCHCVEDIDVAFTRVGAHDKKSKLTLEQYYPNGNLDWGASLFYMSFLGRCPLNLLDLTKYTGHTPAQTAKAINISIDELYDTYSVADNWQLTAPSYVDSSKQAHRLLGDLTTEETIPFINELFDKAEEDLLFSFPDIDAQSRIKEWFESERNKLTEFSRNSKRLSTLYQNWLQSYFDKSCIIKTSEQAELSNDSKKILQRIVRNYQLFVKLYNESIAETSVELSPIDPDSGDLPFFAIYQRNGHLVRSSISIKDRQLVAGDLNYEVDSFLQNVQEISGKALLLVIIARLHQTGSALALPLNGSLYTPAAKVLEEKMIEHGFISEKPHPITRVRFNFLNKLIKTDTTIRLPEYMHEFFPSEMSTKKFSQTVYQKIEQAKETLEKLENKDSRKNLFQSWFPALTTEIAELKQLKNNYGRDPEKRHMCSEIWRKIKENDQLFHKKCYQKIVNLYHISQLDYWDSRGALLPWSIAAGGKGFYEELIETAEFFNE